ncbi:MAG: 3'-5' exonuclease, partial [Thermoproteota archaeon]
MKLWLLDLNTEFLLGKDAVFLWGISNEGKRLLLVDDNVESFFFLKPLNGVNPDEAIREAFPEGKRHGVTRMEVCDKLVLGKPVKVVKVCVDRSDNVEKAVGRLEKLKLFEKAYESDLRLSTRYLLEKNLTPSSWLEAEVERNPLLPSIPNVEAFKVKAVRPLEEEKAPELRVMAVHLLKVGGKGSPKPEYDPIVAISTYDGKELKQFRFDGKTDKHLIEGFLDQVKRVDPDVIVGYGITEDWIYLAERCKREDVQLEVGRNYAKPHTSVFGHVSVTGRISIDLFHNARENPQLTEYTLDEYAESLGLKVGQMIPEHKYSEYLSSASEAEKLFKQSE